MVTEIQRLMVAAVMAAFALALVSPATARPDLSVGGQATPATTPQPSKPSPADAPAPRTEPRVEPKSSDSTGSTFDWPAPGILASTLLAAVGVVLTAAASAALLPRARDSIPRP